MLRTGSRPYPSQPGYPGEGTGSCRSSSHVPACAPTLHPGCPNCVAKKSLLVQGHASGRLLQHRGGACVQESWEHTPCQLQGRGQITPQPPLCPSRTDQNQLWFPQPWLTGVSLPRALALHVYVTAGVASSEQSRSLLGAWKSQGTQGNNDRSRWGGDNSRRRIPRHSTAQPGAAAAINTDPSWLPRVPALPWLQHHRTDEKVILRYWLSFWDKEVCDSHTHSSLR